MLRFNARPSLISGTVAWYLTFFSVTTAREHCHHIAGFDKYTPAIFLSYCCGVIYVGRVPRKRHWSPDWKESKQRNGINASFDRVRFRFLLPITLLTPLDTGIAHLRLIYGQAIFYMFRRNNTIALSSKARKKLADEHKNSTSENLVPLTWWGIV